MIKKLEQTTQFIQKQLEGFTPELGIILGSGLGNFAEQVENKKIISYSDIPNFPMATVKGHAGKLICGTIGQTKVAVFQGRFHYYEGHSLEDVVLPTRILAKLGTKALILTNAAGGINKDFAPGELVAITDHLNLTGNSPLIGPNSEELGVRFPDMSEAYNLELNKLLNDVANELNIPLKSGVYAGVLGPAYETPAEINMLKTLGADMVGMSTVPESIAANHAGLKVCGISCITNLAAGISKEKLSHDDVKDVANMAMEKFTKLVTTVVKKWGQSSI